MSHIPIIVASFAISCQLQTTSHSHHNHLALLVFHLACLPWCFPKSRASDPGTQTHDKQPKLETPMNDYKKCHHSWKYLNLCLTPMLFHVVWLSNSHFQFMMLLGPTQINSTPTTRIGLLVLSPYYNQRTLIGIIIAPFGSHYNSSCVLPPSSGSRALS